MTSEIVGRRRNPARGQIGGACADHAPDRTQTGGDQAAVRQGGDSKRDVDLIVQKMSDPVGQHETDRDLREGREEIRDHGQDMQPAEHGRRGDHQISLGLRILPGGGAFRLGQLLQNGPCRRDVGTTGRGQLQPLRRADQQAGVEMALQLGDLATDRRERKPELSARLRKTAALHGREQHRHGVKTVQRLSKI